MALLKTLFGDVLIPDIVHRELLAKTGPESERLDAGFRSFIRITGLAETPIEVQAVIQALDPGESGAIALAHETRHLLLIDDRLGRLAAQQLGLAITGTAGVLLAAKQADLLPQVKPVLEEIRDAGYWLSDELIAVAARLANEA